MNPFTPFRPLAANVEDAEFHVALGGWKSYRGWQLRPPWSWTWLPQRQWWQLCCTECLALWADSPVRGFWPRSRGNCEFGAVLCWQKTGGLFGGVIQLVLAAHVVRLLDCLVRPKILQCLRNLVRKRLILFAILDGPENDGLVLLLGLIIQWDVQHIVHGLNVFGMQWAKMVLWGWQPWKWLCWNRQRHGAIKSTVFSSQITVCQSPHWSPLQWIRCCAESYGGREQSFTHCPIPPITDCICLSTVDLPHSPAPRSNNLKN